MAALFQVVSESERALLAKCALLPMALVSLMKGLTHLGNGWLWVITLAASFWIHPKGPQRVLLAAALANLAIAMAKNLFQRPRPISDAAALAGSPLAFDRFSFPSGHTTNAFGWAGCAVSFSPDFAPGFLLVASLIGVSRVLLRVHYPSDVFAGAVIGWVLGLLSGRVVP